MTATPSESSPEDSIAARAPGVGGSSAVGDPTAEGHRFTAVLWLWEARRADSWTFVTLPDDVAEEARERAAVGGPRRGFGAVKVAVAAGGITWRTSVFPDAKTGGYVLPVKGPVRRRLGVGEGDELVLDLTFV